MTSLKKEYLRLHYLITVFLFVLGISAYFISKMESITALIPTFFSLVFFLFLYLFHARGKVWAFWVMIFLTLIGLMATSKGVLQFPRLVAGMDVLRPFAVIVQTIMFVSLLTYALILVYRFYKSKKKFY